MDYFSLNSFNSPSEIPKETLINLLKSDRLTDSLLDWASKQCDREIALAILMNQKTSQQHLEKLFQTFDDFILERYGLVKPIEHHYYLQEYKEYKDAWDILCNIENHINWEQKVLKNSWKKNIIYKIASLQYPDTFWSNSLAKIVNLNCDNKIQIIVDNSEASQIYKKLFWQLRKLRKLPYKKKESAQINQCEIIKVQKAKSSDELIKLLAHKDQDFEIKFAILENFYLTREILVTVLDNAIERQNCVQLLQDQRFEKAFDKYPNIAKKFLEKLAMREDNKNNQWNLYLAECSHTPIHILKKLAKSYENGILIKLANNPKTPECILLKLVKLNNYDINAALRLNHKLSDGVNDKLLSIKPIHRFASSNYDVWYLACSKDTSVNDLKKIALTSDDYRILNHVVLNPNTNTEILQILSQDIDMEVRSQVAKDHKTPLTIIEKLAKDENEEVRYGVLNNPNLTKDIFHRLMPDIYGSCNYSLGRLLAFLDPNVSPEILEQNANSLLWNERFAIAVHPKTPKQTIEQLAKDGNIYVRAAASERNHDSTVFK